MQVLVGPLAEAQILRVDGWWRENLPAALGRLAAELAALIEAWPLAGRRRRHPGVPGLRRVLRRATRYHVYDAPIDRDQLVVLAVGSAVRGGGLRRSPLP